MVVIGERDGTARVPIYLYLVKEAKVGRSWRMDTRGGFKAKDVPGGHFQVVHVHETMLTV